MIPNKRFTASIPRAILPRKDIDPADPRSPHRATIAREDSSAGNPCSSRPSGKLMQLTTYLGSKQLLKCEDQAHKSMAHSHHLIPAALCVTSLHIYPS
jgi:hypothetical protein